jgi:hypothetical protein
MHLKGMMVRFVEPLSNLVVAKKGGSVRIFGRVKESLRHFDELGLQYGALLYRSSERDLSRTKFKNSLFSGTKKAAR